MSTFGKNQQVYRLHSFLRYECDERSYLLQLDDNCTLTTTGHIDSESPNVNFYVETQWESNGRLQYQIKPYSKPDKYIAIVGGQVALKAKNECTESQRTFYSYQENEDYQSFSADIEDSTYYLGCTKDGGLYASTEKTNNRASWFHVQLPNGESFVPATNEANLFLERNLSIEVVVAEE